METDTPVTPRATRRGWVMAAVVGLVALAGLGWLATPGARPAVPVDPGAAAADLEFIVKDMHGKDVRLADFKGRPIVLNFWATYCAPCKHEIPIFVDLVEKYRDQKLAVLGVSIDDAADDLRPFAEQFKMNYPVLVGLGQDRLLETYDAVFFIPVTWFIRPDGTVSLKHPGSATREWFEEQVKAILPKAGAL
jgi:cytochrome c biogenesis protein CcmG/thiol:disulfide interchange protein DsbE